MCQAGMEYGTSFSFSFRYPFEASQSLQPSYANETGGGGTDNL